MSQTEQEPLKACQTCAYRDGLECTRSGFYWRVERQFSNSPGAHCDVNFSGWRPQPPKPQRRSLRRWLADLL